MSLLYNHISDLGMGTRRLSAISQMKAIANKQQINAPELASSHLSAKILSCDIGIVYDDHDPSRSGRRSVEVELRWHRRKAQSIRV